MSRRRKRKREKDRRHRRAPRARIAAGAGLTVGTAFAVAPMAHAADFTVDDPSDAALGTCTAAANDCSLRDAVDQTNADPAGDRILFQSSITGITLTAGELGVYYPVEIVGPGAGALTISGDDNSRILYLAPLGPPGMDVSVSGVTLADGYADDGYGGGAIRSEDANLTIAGSAVTDNEANYLVTMNSVAGGGVAAYDGSLTVRDSTVAGNNLLSDIAGGGGIYANGTTSVTVSDSTVAENTALGFAAIGAGIATYDAGAVTIERSTVTGNVSPGGSGSFARGGGVATKYSSSVLIERSTITGNESASSGGGLHSSDEPLSVRNSTVSGNTAAYYGGGINSSDGTVELTNTTVAANRATSSGSYGGGVFLCDCSQAAISNSILADNSADNGPDLHLSGGAPPDTAFSLIEGPIGGGTINETVVGSNKLGVDPQLAPLGSNGGPTQTHAPAMGSPALDAGSSFGAGIDQRGSPRPFDFMSVPNSAAGGANGADIGAFELQGSNPSGEGPGCQGKPATILAKPGVKTTGTPGNDVIVGTDGRDDVDGGGGDDFICLLNGEDKAKGGAGRDVILGGQDADGVKGGSGDDRLRGRGGADRLAGKNGDDRIRGGHGDDELTGGPGNDRMRGGAGADLIDGRFEEDGKRHGGGGADDRGGGKHGSKG